MVPPSRFIPVGVKGLVSLSSLDKVQTFFSPSPRTYVGSKKVTSGDGSEFDTP